MMYEKRTPTLRLVAFVGDHTVQEVLVEEGAGSGNGPFHSENETICVLSEHAAM